MKLEFTEKESNLSFKVNDGDECIITNITREIELDYRLAIALVRETRSFELL